MPFFLALFQLLFIPFQTSALLASAPRAFSGTDRHEPGEVVEEENALSISRVKRLCFYTNPTSSPHSAAAVLFLCLQYVSGGCPAAPRTRLNAKCLNLFVWRTSHCVQIIALI